MKPKQLVDELKLGLRFARSEGPKLRRIAEQLRETRPPDIDISVFDKAAESAERGEPLIVVCSEAREAELMAHGFTRWGIERPAIDRLNGTPVIEPSV